MNNFISVHIQIAALAAVHGVLAAAEPSTPMWIGGPADAVRWTASSSLILAGPPVSAKLKFAADFARTTVRLNDHVVAVVAPYCQMTVLDVSNWMQVGENHIQVLVERTEGPTAIPMQLEIKMASASSSESPAGIHSGSPVQWMSNESWNCTANGQQTKVKSLGQVRDELWGAGRRDIELSPLENYEQWRQSLGGDSSVVQPKFWSVPGFEVTQIRSAAADESSWISLAQDS